jgi:hypothetical protein
LGVATLLALLAFLLILLHGQQTGQLGEFYWREIPAPAEEAELDESSLLLSGGDTLPAPEPDNELDRISATSAPEIDEEHGVVALTAESRSLFSELLSRNDTLEEHDSLVRHLRTHAFTFASMLSSSVLLSLACLWSLFTRLCERVTLSACMSARRCVRERANPSADEWACI